MKKIIVILTMFVLAISTNVSAQTSPASSTFNQVAYMSYSMFLPIYMNYEGLSIKSDATGSTAEIPDGMGTIKFKKSGDKFADAVYTDAAGKTTRLVPVQSFSNPQKPACKNASSQALFASADGSISMSICKSPVLADGSAPFTVSLLLPAVQKVREAAARN